MGFNKKSLTTEKIAVYISIDDISIIGITNAAIDLSDLEDEVK